MLLKLLNFWFCIFISYLNQRINLTEPRVQNEENLFLNRIAKEFNYSLFWTPKLFVLDKLQLFCSLNYWCFTQKILISTFLLKKIFFIFKASSMRSLFSTKLITWRFQIWKQNFTLTLLQSKNLNQTIWIFNKRLSMPSEILIL